MPNPDQQPIDLGDKFPQLRDMKYLVVDTEGGFLAKHTGKLLSQMDYLSVHIAVIDQVGLTQEQLRTQIDASDMIICTDTEAESRIRSLLGDSLKPLITLGLTAQDRYEATPRDSAGSASTDNAQIMTQIEEKLISFGFEYPKT